MNGNNSSATSVTATPDESAALLVLQQIKGHVMRAAAEFDEITSPETRHKEKVEQIDSLLDERFKCLRKHQPSDDKTIEHEVIQYAGERRLLEINGLRDAQKEYEVQIASVLETLSDQLIVTMGPPVVKRLLQSIAPENLWQYIPGSLLGFAEQSTVHSESVRFSSDFDLDNAGNPAINGSETGHSSGSCPSRDTERNLRNPGNKHPRHDPDDVQHRPKKRYNISDAVTSPTQGQNDVTYPEHEHPATSNAASESPVLPVTRNPRAAHEDQNSTNNSVSLYFVDADNRPIGMLKQAFPWGNERVDSILHEHIKRPVRIRRERRFNRAHLHAISGQSGMKGVKLVSCMIQATGELMDQRCQYCRKNQGAFEDCITLDNNLFPRCGNCEWGRQRCVPSAELGRPASNKKHVRKRMTQLPSGPSANVRLQDRPSTSLVQLPNPTSTETGFIDLTAVPSQPHRLRQADTGTSAPHEARRETLATHYTAQGNTEFSRAGDGCYAEDFSDTDSYSGVSVTWSDWRIHQIKTRFFTSATRSTQYWSWAEEGHCLKYGVLHGIKPLQWEFASEPVDFDINLNEVASVRGSVKSLRACLVMNKSLSISKQDESPRGDVMVVFKRERTTQRFLRFCRALAIVVIEEEPPVMVDLWRNMESATLLPDGE